MLGPKGKTRYEIMAAAANEAMWAELTDAKKRLTSILCTVSYVQHNEALAFNTPLAKFAQAVIAIIETPA
jgi:phenylalanine-4-hydroxylase